MLNFFALDYTKIGKKHNMKKTGHLAGSQSFMYAITAAITIDPKCRQRHQKAYTLALALPSRECKL